MWMGEGIQNRPPYPFLKKRVIDMAHRYEAFLSDIRQRRDMDDDHRELARRLFAAAMSDHDGAVVRTPPRNP